MLRYFEARNFAFQRGAIMPSVKLAYRTIGELNSARDNVVLVPSWYSGNDDDAEAFMCGPDRALNPDKYFIVFTNLLGGGRSSSPSNSPEPFEKARFPKATYYDNVKLQHMLLTEELGIDSIRLVTGWSMGAAQAYQWSAQYPDMVRAAAPIAGSAKTASYNKVFLYSLQRALRLDRNFKGGYYTVPPLEGLKAFAAIYAGWGVSEPFFRNEGFHAFGASDFQEFVAYFWEPFFQKCDANDLLAQLDTWMMGDISDNPDYGGDFTKALASITARVITLPVDLDRYFPPVDAQSEARAIPNGECRTVSSQWGHMAPMNLSDIGAFDEALSELLA